MKPLASALSSAVLLAAFASCARTAEERQLDAMRSDIERIQTDRDHADDGAPLGSGLPQTPARSVPPVPAPPPPAFDAVQTTGDDDVESAADYADPQDTAPRPVIRIIGSARSGRSGPDDGVVDSSSEDSNDVSIDPEAKRAYDAALSQVNAKQYGPALTALAAFLVKWPDHPYADHAMYWRGECYFAQRDFARAAEEFEGVLARFPSGMKAPDALLKLGMTYGKLGQAAQARAAFDRLVQDYPQSDAARQVPASPSDPATGDPAPADSQHNGGSSASAPQGHP